MVIVKKQPCMNCASVDTYWCDFPLTILEQRVPSWLSIAAMQRSCIISGHWECGWRMVVARVVGWYQRIKYPEAQEHISLIDIRNAIRLDNMSWGWQHYKIFPSTQVEQMKVHKKIDWKLCLTVVHMGNTFHSSTDSGRNPGILEDSGRNRQKSNWNRQRISSFRLYFLLLFQIYVSKQGNWPK